MSEIDDMQALRRLDAYLSRIDPKNEREEHKVSDFRALIWRLTRQAAQLAAPASKSPLTDAELADPEYMRAYVAAQHEDFSDLLQANRDCIDHFNQLKADYDALAAPADLVRRLLADHQRVEPHHADQCQLCREATAAIEGQPHPSEVEAGQRGLASLQAAMGGNASVNALHAAVCAIYFDDSSDYLSALWEVVNVLAPELANELAVSPGSAYNRTRDMLAMLAAGK